MKIEIVKNNVVLVNPSNENFEIHPLWLRERLNKRTKRSAAGTVFQTSNEVAVECLDGFTKDKQFIIPGKGNRRTALITKFMPRTKVLSTVGSLFKKVAG